MIQRPLILICVAFVVSVAACGLDTEPTTLTSPASRGDAIDDSDKPASTPKKSSTKSKSKPKSTDTSADKPAKKPADKTADNKNPNGSSVPTGDTPDDTDTCANECDDDDVCTRDVQTIQGGDCTCSHIPVAVRGGDGCCPVGASASDDSDCDVAAQCGNGEVDPGEACDGGDLCGKDCTPLFDASLVHRYTFDGEGRDVPDSVGEADGMVVNGMLNGDGDLVLSGGPANTYVQLPAGMISSLVSATVEVWLTPVRGGAGQRVFDFGSQNGTEGATYWALTPNSIADGNAMTLLNLTPQVDVGSGDQYLSGRSPIGPGMLHDVAVVFDADAKNLSLYVDGALQGNRTGINGSLSQIDDMNVWIGRAQFGNYPYYNGRIHDFRIYDHALSASAISASYAAGPNPNH